MNLVWKALEDMRGGEIYVKKIPSMNIMDIAKAVSETYEFEIVGIRPGEKLHEQMIGIEDAPYTREYLDYFKILPQLNEWHLDTNRIKDGLKVNDDFVYCSNLNSDWMSKETLRNWLEKNEYFIGKT